MNAVPIRSRIADPVTAGAAGVTVSTLGAQELDAEGLNTLGRLIPDDDLGPRRLRNLSVAERVAVASLDGRAVGLVFMRRIAGIPNVTWIVAPEAQRRGVALRLLQALQQESRWLTAICRTSASAALARKAGFTLVLGTVAIWARRGRA